MPQSGREELRDRSLGLFEDVMDLISPLRN